MGQLVYLGGPTVGNPVGAVTKIVNAKQQGATGMHWSFEPQGGFYVANRRYTNTLRVITNSQYVGSIQVQQAVLGIGAVQGATYRFPLPELNGDAGLPAVPCETDTGSFCQSIEIAQDQEDGKQWLITIQYASLDINHEMGNSQTQNGTVNPLEAAPKVHWSSAKYLVNYPLDVNGLPFINTVGDPLEDPPQTEETRQVLHFARNEEDYNDSWAQQFRDTVNSDTFLGWNPGQAKCRDIQGERQYSTDFGYYWEVSYEFEFRIGSTIVVDQTDNFGAPIGTASNTTGWTERVLNSGLRQLAGGTGAPQQILIDGALVTSPVPLQQNGVYTPITATVPPYYLDFTLYPSSPFAQLNIPQNVLTQSQ